MLITKLVLVAPIVASVVLYLLLGLSVLSIGVIIERWWFFQRRREDIGALSEELRLALKNGGVDGARKLLGSSRSVEAAVIVESLDWYAQGPESVEQIVAKAIRVRRKQFENGLVFLGTLGSNAPFVGLFGTVLGIVTAFKALGATTANAAGAANGMNNVMSSISEALVATAIGILVAIPAVVAYNIFQKKGTDVEENANTLANVVLATLRSRKPGKATALEDEDSRLTATAELGS